MHITTTLTDGIALLKITGAIVIGEVGAAKQDLLDGMGQSGKILMDLTEVETCDTAGVQLMLLARASAKAQGKSFVILHQPLVFFAAADRIGIPDGCFDYQKGSR